MDKVRRYQIIYTETAVQDIEEKVDYIGQKFRDPLLAEKWYRRLRASIQKDLEIFPYKYALYQTSPWTEKGIRLLITQNDVVLYSVDDAAQRVIVHAVCTRGRDLSAHLMQIFE